MRAGKFDVMSFRHLISFYDMFRDVLVFCRSTVMACNGGLG